MEDKEKYKVDIEEIKQKMKFHIDNYEKVKKVVKSNLKVKKIDDYILLTTNYNEHIIKYRVNDYNIDKYSRYRFLKDSSIIEIASAMTDYIYDK